MIVIKKKAGVSQSYGAFATSITTGEEILQVVLNDTLEGADLSKLNLSCANLQGANLANADLTRCNLSMAILSNADLSNANLSQADLYACDLSSANLSKANLEKAYLSSANLRGADLRMANLTEATLKGCYYDKATHWPEGVDEATITTQIAPRRQSHRSTLQKKVRSV